MIRLSCRCGATIHLERPLPGHLGRCPGCGAPLRAPDPPLASPAPPPAPAPVPRGLARVRCACGRLVPAPRARLEQGLCRCPSCDRRLEPGREEAPQD